MKLLKKYPLATCVYFFALITTGMVFYKCSKIDTDGLSIYLNQSPADVFLHIPANTNPIFQRIAAAIKVQDDRLHFLKNIAVKEGIPRWEGSTILANAADVRSAAAGSANNSSGVSGDTVVLVPLVKANTSYVNSFLACKVNDTVTILLFRGKDYAKFGFGSSGNGLTAESMAIQMMTLQKQSFGHRMFSIGDKRLFNRLANGRIPKRTFVKIGKEPVQGAVATNTSNVLSLTVPVTTTTCEDIWVSNDDGEVVGCPPGDPNCNGGHYETQCQSTTYWIDIIDDAGGGGVPLSDGNNNNNNNNPNGNGGSSNNGNTGSPECPDGNWWCALSDYRILNGIVVTEEFFPGIELGFPWLWWEDDNWLDKNFSLNVDEQGGPYDAFKKLTVAEKTLVHKYPGAAYSIYKNKTKAETETSFLYGVNGLNDISDAFRHAFFNAMNERDCGKDNITMESIARLFSDAHETETPSQLQIESTMDKWNNNIGQQIGDVFFPIFVSDNDLENEVIDKLKSGELRYLDPLDFVNYPKYHPVNCPNCTDGIYSLTKLIPTK